MPNKLEENSFSYENEQIGSSDFEIIGTGTIGDKARQLMEKTPRLKELSFYVHPRTVLAQSFLDDFLQHNNIGESLVNTEPSTAVQKAIGKGSFTEAQMVTFKRIVGKYGNSPLAVRSSAVGDARGTGTYASEYTDNRVDYLKRSVQRVLASYYSEGAQAFRQDAQTGEGFGILLEPLIGQPVFKEIRTQYPLIAPILSGFAYTSTSKGDGYLRVIPGLGSGVNTKEGETITQGDIERHDGNLMRVITEKYYNDKDRQQLFGDAYGDFFGTIYEKKQSQNNSLYRENYYVKPEVNAAVNDLNLRPFFENMESMEQSFGSPQYVEWAMTVENGAPKFWLIQIADVNKKLDTLEFGSNGQELFEAYDVTGSGIKYCSQIITCENRHHLERLLNFNRANKDYALIFSSGLSTRHQALNYSHYSNASVLLEIDQGDHSGKPISHLGTQAEMTGKLFGVLKNSEESPWALDRFEKKPETNDLEGYEGNIRVVASEKKDRLVVYEEDPQEPIH